MDNRSRHKAETFDKVRTMCEGLMGELDGREASRSEATSVAAAYLIAMERTGTHHHPEDAPDTVFPAEPWRDAMQGAWAAVWQVIGDANTNTNPDRYTAAWDVWGCVGGEDGMGDE